MIRRGANKYTAYTYITETHKQCSSCREIKVHADFTKDRKNIRGVGLGYYCKACANNRARALHASRIDDPEYKQSKRSQYFKSRYGLTLDEYIEKLKAQDFLCAICGVELPTSGPHTHLDHCHKSGKIRAFLCTNCNRGLGHFQDSIENLKSAVTYLESHSTDVDGTKEE